MRPIHSGYNSPQKLPGDRQHCPRHTIACWTHERLEQRDDYIRTRKRMAQHLSLASGVGTGQPAQRAERKPALGKAREAGNRKAAITYLGSQDTFYVGTLKGVGRICQQTYVDTYCKVAHAKLYTTKTPITAADMLNDRVLPFYEEHDLPALHILTDRGTEYCGRVDKHDYQLFLAINDIDHTKTKVKSPQTNGICERFHKTILQEFYQITFRKKLYETVKALQADLDEWIDFYNTERTHQGKMCCGRTPFQTMIEGKEIWKEKFVN